MATSTYDSVIYCNAGDQATTGYYAVVTRPRNTAVAAGVLRRQASTPTVGNERVFVCIVAGTTQNVADATWSTGRGAKTTDNTVTWQECTGVAAVNGDITNTLTWAQAKASGSTPALGAIIKRANGASYWICSTAGTLGASEPSWPNDTAGTQQSDGTTTWTCIGVVGNFTGGQAPHSRLTNALTSGWFSAGNTAYVGDNHAETSTAAIVPSPTLSQTTTSKIICHNHLGPYPPAAAADLATTATISTSIATPAAFTFSVTAGFLYVYGITFIVGAGQSVTTNFIISLNMALCVFEACVFKISSSGISCLITLNSNFPGTIIWDNCQVSFANAGQSINVGNAATSVNFWWGKTSAVLAGGSTTPTNLFLINTSGTQTFITLEGLDLSAWTSVFALASSNPTVSIWMIKDCKLNASASFSSPTGVGHTIQVLRADGGNTAYKSARYTLDGTETTETSITRVGGAVDPTGQAQSRKIVTSANVQWLRPFKAEPYAIWNATTGQNVTVTVFGTINAASLPNNDDIWIDINYLGTASFPQSVSATTTKATLFSANGAVGSDTSTWNGGGSGAGWTPFKLTKTLSTPQPQFAGYIDVRVRVAKAGTTYYIDPQVVLS